MEGRREAVKPRNLAENKVHVRKVHVFLSALLQKLGGDFFLIFRREIWEI